METIGCHCDDVSCGRSEFLHAKNPPQVIFFQCTWDFGMFTQSAKDFHLFFFQRPAGVSATFHVSKKNVRAPSRATCLFSSLRLASSSASLHSAARSSSHPVMFSPACIRSVFCGLLRRKSTTARSSVPSFLCKTLPRSQSPSIAFSAPACNKPLSDAPVRSAFIRQGYQMGQQDLFLWAISGAPLRFRADGEFLTVVFPQDSPAALAGIFVGLSLFQSRRGILITGTHRWFFGGNAVGHLPGMVEVQWMRLRLKILLSPRCQAIVSPCQSLVGLAQPPSAISRLPSSKSATSLFRLVICAVSIPIEPWSPSSLGRTLPLIADIITPTLPSFPCRMLHLCCRCWWWR